MATVTFDGPNKIINVATASSNVEVKSELYSAWKEWVQIDDNAKFDQAFRAVGGDPLPGSKTLGTTYFLDSDWKIRPYETDYVMTVNGNLYSEDGTSVYTQTTGSWNVQVESAVSNLVDSTLAQSDEIEYASYGGGVSIDVDSGYAGTDYPNGTERQKVNNMSDALAIAANRGFNTLLLYSDLTLDSTAQISDYSIKGHSHVDITVTVEDAATVNNVLFENVKIEGVLDGQNEINNCIVGNITYLNGHIHNGTIQGTIYLGGSKDAFISNLSQLDIDVTPGIDMGGGGQDLVMTNYSGRVLITNMTGSNSIGIGLDQGGIMVDSTTVTSGYIAASGIGQLTDENGLSILSGTWNGGVTIDNRLINRETITEASQLGEAVYIDTAVGVSGSSFPTGTDRTPSNNLDDAITIAVNNNIKTLRFKSDYTFPDGTFIQEYLLEGDGILDTTFTFESDTSGCIVLGCSFSHATLTGNFTGVKAITDCRIVDLGSIGLAPSSQEILVDKTLIDGVITLPSNYFGKLTVRNCYSNVVGAATPTLNFGNSTANAQIRNYTGGMAFTNMTQGNIVSLDLISGQLKLDSSSVTNATIVVRGSGKVIDLDTGEFIPSGVWNGGVTIYNEATNPAYTADAVWDESLTGATHNIPTSAGRRLRDIASSVVTTGTTVSSTVNTITLNGDASTVDGAYDPTIITITNGTGFGQSRLILEYNGATKTAVVDRNWKVNPDATSEYAIVANPGREHINEGLAQGGGTNSITLNALASSEDGNYVGQVVSIRSGTGEDQACRVSAYDGTTKVATMSRDWHTVPDTTSAYVMLPSSVLDTARFATNIATAVWNKTLPEV